MKQFNTTIYHIYEISKETGKETIGYIAGDDINEYKIEQILKENSTLGKYWSTHKSNYIVCDLGSAAKSLLEDGESGYFYMEKFPMKVYVNDEPSLP